MAAGGPGSRAARLDLELRDAEHLIGPPPPAPATDWRTGVAALAAATIIHLQAALMELPGGLDLTGHLITSMVVGNALLFYALRRREAHLREQDDYQREVLAWARLEQLVRQEAQAGVAWREAS